MASIKMRDGRVAKEDRHIVKENGFHHGIIIETGFDEATRQNTITVAEVTRPSKKKVPYNTSRWEETGRERVWYAGECIALETANAMIPESAFADDLTYIKRRDITRLMKLCAKHDCTIVETDSHYRPFYVILIERYDGKLYSTMYAEYAEAFIAYGYDPGH